MKTILSRCCSTYEDTLELIEDVPLPTPQLVAAVLEHIAGELRAMAARDPSLTVAQVARLLDREAAAVPMPNPEPPETWATHPSLTVKQRNPTLR